MDEERRQASVLVHDNGRGIPADQLERVFDKFHRVEDPLRMTTSGTGLGLFIARQLAVAMGGTLSVESTLGQGATFVFTLPLAPAGSNRAAVVHLADRIGRGFRGGSAVAATRGGIRAAVAA